jgi:hypothetical protein
LVVHIVSGSGKEAYWVKPEYPYWESKDIPFWRSIRLLRELGLRPHDVVRINLGDNATWSHDIAEVRKRYPSQRLSLQIHRHDMNLHRDNLPILARKIVDVLPYIEEFQIDESLSAGQQGNIATYAHLYEAIRSHTEKAESILSLAYSQVASAPERWGLFFSQILRYCRSPGQTRLASYSDRPGGPAEFRRKNR